MSDLFSSSGTLLALFFIFALFELLSARNWLQNSLNSYNCMNFAAIHRKSSRSTNDSLHKLSANGSGLGVVTKWCSATSGLRFRICNNIYQIFP